jgi:hypothetical protein
MKTMFKKDFLVRQPSFPIEQESDAYYLKLVNKLATVLRRAEQKQRFSDDMLLHLAYNLSGYMQDIISDAGVWRSFVTGCRELYGYSVPFFPISEDYIDYELNREDVRFIVWYSIAMCSDRFRFIYPHDPYLLSLADAAYDYLDGEYEYAPDPIGYNIGYGLDFSDADDKEAIYNLSYWLFVNSYLLPPAFAKDLNEILESPEITGKGGDVALSQTIEDAITNASTGPLALIAAEWAFLMLHGRIPHEKEEHAKPIHKYYDAFTKATGGEEIRFFATYDELNDFFISALGWDADTDHFESLRDDKDFVLLVNPEKGMLVAKNVAKCFAAPNNPLYDKAYAGAHAFECISVRGRCPADLVRYACKRGWLPDAAFPGTDDTKLVADNWDFIARCYLLKYYRD